MLETVDRGIKRAPSKSKLSELKRSRKQVDKNIRRLGGRIY